MKSTNEIPELYTYPSDDFENHLALEGNERIIFSGIFGIGKTSFLQHFFSEERQAKQDDYKKYNVIHLFPVNYSVASNEDIFKYLKLDIMYELIGKEEIEIDKLDFSFIDKLPFFIQENIIENLSPLLLLVPEVGKELSIVYKGIEKIAKKLKIYQDKVVKGEKQTLQEFIRQALEKEGSLYETNIITQIIVKLLEQWKEATNRETILILDDLDRIDPHHIFRLFNVFAAHIDNKPEAKGVNKFLFDKIIFVCDIQNVQNIFKNRYGADVDFNGYIDKFFSREIYHFDNREIIKDLLRKIFFKIKVEHRYGNSFDIEHFRKYALLHEDTVFIVSEMIRKGSISLRSIIKYQKSNSAISFSEKQYSKQGVNRVVKTTDSVLIIQLQFLKMLFGNFSHLIDALKKLELNGIDDTDNHRIGETLRVLAFDIYGFGAKENNNYKDPDTNITYKFSVRTDSRNIFTGYCGFMESASIYNTGVEENRNKNLNYFKLLKESAEQIHEWEFL